MPLRLVGFVLFLLALGTLRMIGCGDESPCGSCDDGDPCTIDECSSRRIGDPPGLCEPDDREVEYYCSNGPEADGTSCGGDNVCVNGACMENLCAGCDSRDSQPGKAFVGRAAGCFPCVFGLAA
jgi:hypothetical protein